MSTNKCPRTMASNRLAHGHFQGFDLTGLDFHTGGTLEKNFSFSCFHRRIQQAHFTLNRFARLDNLFGSSWLNIKMGKFELDNLVSEKRIITLDRTRRSYQTLSLHSRRATATSSARWVTTSLASNRWGIPTTTAHALSRVDLSNDGNVSWATVQCV